MDGSEFLGGGKGHRLLAMFIPDKSPLETNNLAAVHGPPARLWEGWDHGGFAVIFLLLRGRLLVDRKYLEYVLGHAPQGSLRIETPIDLTRGPHDVFCR